MNVILGGFVRLGRSAFRTREYTGLLGKPAYARLALHRLKKKGELVLVRRGWWAFPKALPEAVACEISKPCYVSFHSALYLHGLTTQISRVIQLAVVRNGGNYNVFGTKVKEYRVDASRFNNFFSKEGLLLAAPEKAFADCLNTPRACPEVVLKEALSKISEDAARQLASAAGAKRLSRLLKIVGQERTG